MNIKPALLMLGLACAPIASHAQAVSVETIHKFDSILNLYGTLSSPGIAAPPAWEPQQGRLVGVTQAGGDPYPVIGFAGGSAADLSSGLQFSLSLDGSGFATSSLGSAGGGQSLTNMLPIGNGQVVMGTSYAGFLPEGATQMVRTGAVAVLDGASVVRASQPADSTTPGDFQTRGQLARDNAGNVYAPEGYGSSKQRLIRVKPDGTTEVAIDYEAYRRPWAPARVAGRPDQTWLSKGEPPVAILWSDRDDSLYLYSKSSTYSGTKPSCEAAAPQEGYFKPDCTDGGDLRGHLIRVKGAALRGSLPVQEADIEILNYFSSVTGGAPGSASAVLSSIVEDGDYLYGISNQVSGSADGASDFNLWRIRKAGLADGLTPSGTFQIVNHFAPKLDAERVASPLQAGDAAIIGSGLYGPIVRAADGNLYGTTSSDDREVYTSNGRTFSARGAGTIWRLIPGTQADRSDDRLEYVHHLAAAADGSKPQGLSLGPVENGRQWLIGATSGGVDDTVNGTIFKFAIDLPPVSVTAFTANGGQSATVVENDKVLLSWSTAGASVCEPTGHWAGSGAKAASGSEQINAPAQRDDAYILGLRCRSDAGVESEEKQVSVTVQATAPQPEPQPTPEASSEGSGGGGGGLGGAALLLLMGAVARRRG